MFGPPLPTHESLRQKFQWPFIETKSVLQRESLVVDHLDVRLRKLNVDNGRVALITQHLYHGDKIPTDFPVRFEEGFAIHDDSEGCTYTRAIAIGAQKEPRRLHILAIRGNVAKDFTNICDSVLDTQFASKSAKWWSDNIDACRALHDARASHLNLHFADCRVKCKQLGFHFFMLYEFHKCANHDIRQYLDCAQNNHIAGMTFQRQKQEGIIYTVGRHEKKLIKQWCVENGCSQHARRMKQDFESYKLSKPISGDRPSMTPDEWVAAIDLLIQDCVIQDEYMQDQDKYEQEQSEQPKTKKQKNGPDQCQISEAVVMDKSPAPDIPERNSVAVQANVHCNTGFLRVLNSMMVVTDGQVPTILRGGSYLYVIFLYATDDSHCARRFAYVGQSGQTNAPSGRGLVTDKDWFRHSIRKFVPATCKVLAAESRYAHCDATCLDSREYELFLEVQWELNDPSFQLVRGAMYSRTEFPFLTEHPHVTAPNILFALQNRCFTHSAKAGKTFL
jgi:hypothetical protein